MGLDIKTVREILDDVTSQDVGITEDSEILFSMGEPSQSGTICIAVDTSVASRKVEGEEKSTFFFHIDTVANVIKEQIAVIGGIKTGQQKGSKEEA